MVEPDKSHPPKSFDEFWPEYLRAHSRAETRAIHIAGTVAAAACVAGFAKTRRPGWLLAALVTGYAPAWIAHGLLEKNAPKTATNPLWSLRADLKMLTAAMTGTLDSELKRAGVDVRTRRQLA